MFGVATSAGEPDAGNVAAVAELATTGLSRAPDEVAAPRCACVATRVVAARLGVVAADLAAAGFAIAASGREGAPPTRTTPILRRAAAPATCQAQSSAARAAAGELAREGELGVRRRSLGWWSGCGKVGYHARMATKKQNNEGDEPADDVRAEILFPPGLEVSDIPPVRPARPEIRALAAAAKLDGGVRGNSRSSLKPAPFLMDRTDNFRHRRLRIHVERLMQTKQIARRLWAWLGAHGSGFPIDAELLAPSPARRREVALNVRVDRSTTPIVSTEASTPMRV